jgi:glycosyltransferase involved in cell wall biosynthesis
MPSSFMEGRMLYNRERFTNQEGFKEFDFTLLGRHERSGVSALVRARNEEQKIQHCLRSILPLFDEIVFVDNCSEDRTLAIVRALKDREDPGDKIRLHSYPFRLARFGPEHDETPANSVHSAVYYSNWAIAQCAFRYVCKWDGDMVLRREAREPFRQLLQRIQTDPEKCWTFPGQTIYRDLQGDYYCSVGEVNQEIMLFPYGRNPRFYKAAHWECLQSRPPLPVAHFEPVTFYELKFADEDEFAHWSTTDWPSRRKRREWANFHAVRNGEVAGSQFEKRARSFLDDQITD